MKAETLIDDNDQKSFSSPTTTTAAEIFVLIKRGMWEKFIGCTVIILICFFTVRIQYQISCLGIHKRFKQLRGLFSHTTFCFAPLCSDSIRFLRIVLYFGKCKLIFYGNSWSDFLPLSALRFILPSIIILLVRCTERKRRNVSALGSTQ